MPSYSHERLIICVCGILGNSLSFVLTMLCVMCFRYFSGSREGAGMIIHTHQSLRYDLEDPRVLYMQFLIMGFDVLTLCNRVFK